MFSTFLDKASGLLSRRFLVAYWFPTFFAALLLLLPRALVYGVDASWLWWEGLAPVKDYAGLGSSQLWRLALLLLLITLVAYLLKAFTRPIVRCYEGYTWPPFLRRWATARVARRWAQLQRERTEAAKQEDLPRYAHLQNRLYSEYPDLVHLLLPTRLGNALRAAEGYSGHVYGMDAPFWWPRLWSLLPEKNQEAIEDTLSTLVALLNLAVLVGYVTLDVMFYLTACHIPYNGWWAGGTLVLGWLLTYTAYRGATAQARNYGQQVRAAIDLYRFELLKALHCPLPTSPDEERALWERLIGWLYDGDRGAVAGWHYAPPDDEKKTTKDKPMNLKTLWRRFWG